MLPEQTTMKNAIFLDHRAQAQVSVAIHLLSQISQCRSWDARLLPYISPQIKGAVSHARCQRSLGHLLLRSEQAFYTTCGNTIVMKFTMEAKNHCISPSHFTGPEPRMNGAVWRPFSHSRALPSRCVGLFCGGCSSCAGEGTWRAGGLQPWTVSQRLCYLVGPPLGETTRGRGACLDWQWGLLPLAWSCLGLVFHSTRHTLVSMWVSHSIRITVLEQGHRQCFFLEDPA